MLDLFRSIRCENIHGKNAGEAVWVIGYSVGNVRIIVTVTSRSLHQSRFGNARLVHGGNHLLHADRPFARPVGLVPPDGSIRIALGIGADHVRVDVDGHGLTRQSSLQTAGGTLISWRGPKEIAGVA